MHRNDKLHGSWFKEVYSCIVMINSIAPDLIVSIEDVWIKHCLNPWCTCCLAWRGCGGRVRGGRGAHL